MSNEPGRYTPGCWMGLAFVVSEALVVALVAAVGPGGGQWIAGVLIVTLIILVIVIAVRALRGNRL